MKCFHARGVETQASKMMRTLGLTLEASRSVEYLAQVLQNFSVTNTCLEMRFIYTQSTAPLPLSCLEFFMKEKHIDKSVQCMRPVPHTAAR